MAFIPTEEHLEAPGGWIKVDEPTKFTLKVDAIKKEYANEKTVYKLDLSDIESGDRMNESLWETEKAFWRICLFLKSCSVQIVKGTAVDLSDGSYVGKTFDAIVKMGAETAQGKRFAEIAEFMPGKHESLFLESATPAAAAETTTEEEW